MKLFAITVSASGYESITNVVLAESIYHVRNDERNAVDAWLVQNSLDDNWINVPKVTIKRVDPREEKAAACIRGAELLPFSRSGNRPGQCQCDEL